MNSPGQSSSESDPSDRREHLRVPARFEVRFHKTEQAARAFRAWSVNVSAGGLALKVSHAYSLGERLVLTMTVEDQTFDVEAVVAWMRKDVIGVRFEPANDRMREQLNQLAATFEKKP